MNPVAFAGKAIAFDLDGTLVDTLPAMAAGFNQVIAPLIGRPISRQEIVSRLGSRLVEIMAIYQKDNPDQLAEIYLETSVGLHLRHARLYPGVMELVRALSCRGVPLGVVTSKRRKTAIPTLERLGVLGFFRAVVAEDDVARLKPHPEPVEKVAAALGVEPSELLVVGDNPTDMSAAHAAGAAAGAAVWGFYGNAAAATAHWVFEQPTDVLNVCDWSGQCS